MDHREKLEWASKNLDSLKNDIDVVPKSDAYRLRVNYNEISCYHTANLEEQRPIPLREWSLRVGDIVHNLRSSLDSIVYALAKKNLGREPTLDEALRTQFVILDNSDSWGTQCAKWLGNIEVTAQDAIKALQPYHGGYEGDFHCLSALRDMSNIDKHRHILLTTVVAEWSRVELRGPTIPVDINRKGGGKFENGAEIARWRFTDWRPHFEVKVEGYVAIDVRFQYAARKGGGQQVNAYGSVGNWLGVIHDHIRDEVFPKLEPYLT